MNPSPIDPRPTKLCQILGATVAALRASTSLIPASVKYCYNVFGNGSNFMKIISKPNGFNQAIHDMLVSLTHALGKFAMTQAQDYGPYEIAMRSKTDGIHNSMVVYPRILRG